MIKVNFHDRLIGDFLGAVPAVQALAEKEEVLCTYHPEVKELFDMTGLKEWKGEEFEKEIDLRCTGAFQLAIKHDLHMTQAYFPFVGMEVPNKPVRAKFPNIQDIDVSKGKICIAPFSRSLPDNQRLTLQQISHLFYKLGNAEIIVLYHERDYEEMSKLSNEYYGPAPNIRYLTARNLNELVCVIKECRYLISVVSGPSHLAFHLGVKNYLLDNQSCSMKWGVNPDAIKITDPIPTLTAERIMEYL